MGLLEFASAWLSRAANDTFFVFGANMSTLLIFLAVLLFEIYDSCKREHCSFSRLDLLAQLGNYKAWRVLPVIKVGAVAFLLNFLIAPYWMHLESVKKQEGNEWQLRGSEAQVSVLKAQVEDRENNLYASGPAFGNAMDTITVFKTYRKSIGPNAECQIRITSPDEHSNIAVLIKDLAIVGSECSVFGPSDTSGDPDLRRDTFTGMFPGVIIFHAAKDAPGTTQLFLSFRNYIRLERSFTIPPGVPENFLWLQFGPDVKWNTQLPR